jgi:nucleotide-binding universal stress UspA family protein
MLSEWEAQANRRLVDTAPPASSAPTVLKTLVGSPCSAIVRYAEQHHVDLIVLGTHGRGPARAARPLGFPSFDHGVAHRSRAAAGLRTKVTS